MTGVEWKSASASTKESGSGETSEGAPGWNSFDPAAYTLLCHGREGKILNAVALLAIKFCADKIWAHKTEEYDVLCKPLFTIACKYKRIGA